MRAMRAPRTAGFTLAELLVSAVVFSLILLGALQLFDFNTKVARAQLQLTEMQQAQRIAQQELVRALRSVGRGTLPIMLPHRVDAGANPNYDGLAIEVENNVPVDHCYINCGTIRVAPGTDVLTVRGVLSSSLLQVVPTGAAFNPVARTLIVSDPSPTGIPQNLSALRQAIQQNRNEALVLTSPLSDAIYAVVQLDPGSSVLNGPNQITISYIASGTVSSDRYVQLAPGGVFPADFTAVISVGILEEYRYFIRVVGESRQLTRGRFFPNSNVPWNSAVDNARAEMVDNILDLQVALAIDGDVLGSVERGFIEEDGSATDDWLFNVAADTPVDVARWHTAPPGRIGYVRLTTLARTDRRDLQYLSPPITAIEDRAYGEPTIPASEAQRSDRMFRRRVLRSVIDFRNLS